MKVTDEIFLVGGPDLTAGEDAAIYLIHFGDQAALVDGGSGYGFQRLRDHITAAGVKSEQIAYLLLTHCHFDHSGGAREIRRIFGCQTVAHALEAPFLEGGDNTVTAADWYGAKMDSVTIDIKLAEPEEAIALGDRTVHALHLPGHSPGSLAYWVESEGSKVLFGQDVHGPLHSALKSDRQAYRRSLEKMRSLEADILCEGHYGIIHGREEVDRFIRSFLS